MRCIWFSSENQVWHRAPPLGGRRMDEWTTVVEGLWSPRRGMVAPQGWRPRAPSLLSHRLLAASGTVSYVYMCWSPSSSRAGRLLLPAPGHRILPPANGASTTWCQIQHGSATMASSPTMAATISSPLAHVRGRRLRDLPCTTWKTHFGYGHRWPLVTGKAPVTDLLSQMSKEKVTGKCPLLITCICNEHQTTPVTTISDWSREMTISLGPQGTLVTIADTELVTRT
jgi:hypothetical protein